MNPALSSHSPFRQQTKPLRLNTKSWIELASKIFKGHGSNEFDALLFAEVDLEPIEELFVDPLTRYRHAICKLEGETLRLIINRTGMPLCNGCQLLIATNTIPHTEGVDIDSEWATIE